MQISRRDLRPYEMHCNVPDEPHEELDPSSNSIHHQNSPAGSDARCSTLDARFQSTHPGTPKYNNACSVLDQLLYGVFHTRIYFIWFPRAMESQHTNTGAPDTGESFAFGSSEDTHDCVP